MTSAVEAGEVADLRLVVVDLQRRLEELELQRDSLAQATQASLSTYTAPSVPDAPEITKPMATTRVVMHEIILPYNVDEMGICFGGQVLSWIDVCAGMSAKTLARGPCVTASVDAVHFLRPCRLGMVVIIAAMVNRTFSSSMEVGVRVEAEDIRTGRRHHCCSAYLTFVAVGPARSGHDHSQGPPTRIRLPRVMPSTPEQRLIFDEAEGRRQARLQQRAALRSNPAAAAARKAARLQPITHRDGGPTLPPSLILSNPRLAMDSRRGSLDIPQREEPACALQQTCRPVPIEPTAFPLANQQPELPPVPAGQQPIAWAASPKQSLQRVAPELSLSYMTQSIMPQHANTLGITFGGQVMAWMEQCAYISATRLRGGRTLTASLDEVAFLKATHVGDILYITSQVTAIFGTSMEVMVSVHGEDPHVGDIAHCADAYVTLVMVDKAQSPLPLNCELVPQTPPEHLRYKEAHRRRAERLNMRELLEERDATRPGLDGNVLPPPSLMRRGSSGAFRSASMMDLNATNTSAPRDLAGVEGGALVAAATAAGELHVVQPGAKAPSANWPSSAVTAAKGAAAAAAAAAIFSNTAARAESGPRPRASELLVEEEVLTQEEPKPLQLSPSDSLLMFAECTTRPSNVTEC